MLGIPDSLSNQLVTTHTWWKRPAAAYLLNGYQWPSWSFECSSSAKMPSIYIPRQCSSPPYVFQHSLKSSEDHLRNIFNMRRIDSYPWISKKHCEATELHYDDFLQWMAGANHLEHTMTMLYTSGYYRGLELSSNSLPFFQKCARPLQNFTMRTKQFRTSTISPYHTLHRYFGRFTRHGGPRSWLKLEAYHLSCVGSLRDIKVCSPR